MHMHHILCTNHRPNPQRGQPEIAQVHFRSDFIQQVAFPGDVVVDVHDAHDRVEDPDDQEDDPIRRAGGFAAEAVGYGPGDHADESSGLEALVDRALPVLETR